MIFLIAAIIGHHGSTRGHRHPRNARQQRYVARKTSPRSQSRSSARFPWPSRKHAGSTASTRRNGKYRRRKSWSRTRTATASTEAFRVLRTNLEFFETSGGPSGQDSAKVIAVTSANPGSGKTFISVNLAKVLAIKGQTRPAHRLRPTQRLALRVSWATPTPALPTI